MQIKHRQKPGLGRSGAGTQDRFHRRAVEDGQNVDKERKTFSAKKYQKSKVRSKTA